MYRYTPTHLVTDEQEGVLTEVHHKKEQIGKRGWFFSCFLPVGSNSATAEKTRRNVYRYTHTHLVTDEQEGARARGGVKRRNGGDTASALVLVGQAAVRRLEDTHRLVLAAADHVLRQGALGRALSDRQSHNRAFVAPVILWGVRGWDGVGGQGRRKR